MPYLEKDARGIIDAGADPITAGELTYALTVRIQRYLKQKPMSYEQLAIVLGAIEGCKADFIERVLKPYEDKKREVNSDVW